MKRPSSLVISILIAIISLFIFPKSISLYAGGASASWSEDQESSQGTDLSDSVIVHIPADEYADVQQKMGDEHKRRADIYRNMIPPNIPMALIEEEKAKNCYDTAQWAKTVKNKYFMVAVPKETDVDELLKEVEQAKKEDVKIQDLETLVGAFDKPNNDPSQYYDYENQICRDYSITHESPNADTGADPIVLYSGEFRLITTDLAVKSRGFDFEFRRIYRNQWERESPLGYNWTHNYDQVIIPNEDGTTVMFKDEDGQVYGFQKQADGSYKSPYQLFKILKRTSSGYQVDDGRGNIKSFDDKGYLSSIKDRFGNEMSFNYMETSSIKVLKGIRDTQGRLYQLEYNNGKMAALKDPFGRVIKYSYSGSGDLESVQSPTTLNFPNGTTTRYNYSGGNLTPSLNHNLTMIMDPKGQVYLKNTYGERGAEKDKVISQRYGSETAPEMKLSYEDVQNNGGINEVASRTTLVDRLGVKHQYEHNKSGLRLSGDDFKYEYNDNGLLARTISPEGRTSTYAYDEKNLDRTRQGNLISVGHSNALAPATALGMRGTSLGSITNFTYGPYNQIETTAQDGGGERRVVTYKFDDKGNVKSKVIGDLATNYALNEYGQLVREESDGIIREYTYDGASLVEIIEKASNQNVRTTKIQYNEFGFVSSVIDPLGATTHYWVNELGQLIQKRNPLNATTFYSYDPNGNLTSMSIENKDGFNTAEIGEKLRQDFEYDIYDNMVAKKATVSANKQVEERYIYDAEEQLVGIVGIDGVKRTMARDEHGWVVSESENGQALFSKVYNKNGEIVSEKDALGNEKRWDRDELGRVVVFTDPKGTRVKVKYNSFGDIEGYKVTEKIGNLNRVLMERAFVYDRIGRRTKELTRVLEGEKDEWKEFEYVFSGSKLSEVRDVEGLLAKYGYDGFGRVSSVEDPTGNQTNYVYDLNGNVTQMRSRKVLPKVGGEAGGFLETMYSYDLLGRLISQVDKDGAASEFVYDSIDNLISVKDAMGHETKYEYDGIGRFLKETRAGRARNWEWNAKGQLVAFTDGDGQKTEVEYDSNARMISRQQPDGVKSKYEYDVLGRLVKESTGDLVYDYSYDAVGNLVSKKAGEYQQKFEYDGLGRVIGSFDSNDPKKSDDDVVVSMIYNSRNHLLEEVVNGKSVRYEYDGRGNNIAEVYPSGMRVEKSYDPAKALKEVLVGDKSIAKINYALFGWKRNEILGNGTSHEFEYDPMMRLVKERSTSQEARSMSLRGAQSATKQSSFIFDYSYTYDPLDRIKVAQDLREKRWKAYEYNEYDQLKRVAAETRGVIDVGANPSVRPSLDFDKLWSLAPYKSEYKMTFEGDVNSTSPLSSEIASGHRYSKFAGKDITYDSRGNITNDGENQYTYDPWNRLITVTSVRLQVPNQGTSSVVTLYSYDASNRRITKTLGETVTYIYDRWNVVEEYKDNVLARQYIHGDSIDEPVAMIVNNDHLRGGRMDSSEMGEASPDLAGPRTSTYYYHRNYLGNIVAVSDSEGKVVERYDYGAYGELAVINGDSQSSTSSIGNAFTYTGQRYDEESGLYYYKNRYYSAKLGRFLTKDPLGMINGPNLYAYVTNDPINWIDPMGTEKGGFWDKAWGAAQWTGGFVWGMGVGAVNTIKDLGGLAYEVSPIPVAVNVVSNCWNNPFYYYDMAMRGDFDQLTDDLVIGAKVVKGLGNAIVHYDETWNAIVTDYSEKWNNGSVGKGEIFFDALSTVATGGAAGAASKAGKLSKLSKVAKIEKAIDKYSDLRKFTKGSDLEVHHLIEKRFAKLFDIKPREMLSIALTKTEHSKFTKAWRQAIKYGEGTAKATKEEVERVAREVYKDYDNVLKALGLDD